MFYNKNMKAKNCFICGAGLLALFLVFTVLVKTVDVKPIGPLFSEIGFASFNAKSLMNYNDVFYKISQVLGYVCFAVVAAFAFIGFIQLLQRKSIKKVDSNILVLGGFYIIVLALYVLFNKVLIINYRPVLDEMQLASSFPSSHTMLACFVFVSGACVINSMYRKNHILESVVLALITVLSRYLSGVHWTTDIIGSVILSAALIFLFEGCCIRFKK